MKKHNFLYFALGAAIALPACQSDDAPARMQGGVPVSDDVISIHSGISSIEEGSFTQGQGPASASRADDYNDEKYGKWVGEFTNNSGSNVLERFVCYSFYGNQKVMDNVTMSRNKNTNQCFWTEGTWYWPMTGSLDFFAFAPYNYQVGDTYGQSTPPQTSDYHVTVENNAVKLKDFEVNNPPVADVVYAMARNQTRNTNKGRVNLLFQHALSRVEVYIVNKSKYCDVAFHGADFMALRYKGTFTFPNTGTTENADCRGSWSGLGDGLKRFNTSWLGTGYTESPTAEYQNLYYAIAHKNNTDGEVKVLAGDRALFLLPQPIARWNQGDKARADDFRDSNGNDIILDAATSGYKPCLILRGYVKDTRNGVYLYNNMTGAGHDLVVPLNPNSNGAAFSWEAGKSYKYVITFGDSSSNGTDADHTLGWTDQQDNVAVSVSVSCAIQNWNSEKHWMWSDPNYRP